MKRENSAGVVLFQKDNKIQYLILHYEMGHWDFPKGNIEEGESEQQTAAREVEEETGIKDLIFIPFKEKISYFYKLKNELISKQVIYLLAETKTKEVKLSHEHIGFKWLSYEEALKQLTFENTRKILRKAHEIVKKQRNLSDF